jgi:hypothetical protein
MKITVKVKPNARENSLVETGVNTFAAKVSIPPEKGKANEKVIELVSKHFKVPKSRVSIIRGAGSSLKIIEIF